jgi:hypothetical protein
LGERLLCKQEVVGSIPSGSTNFRVRGAASAALAKSRNSAGGDAACRFLLHREEGIDLRLPQSRKDASSCGGMPLTSVSEANRFRCRVDLDENLVLTSASVQVTDVD